MKVIFAATQYSKKCALMNSDPLSLSRPRTGKRNWPRANSIDSATWTAALRS